METQAEVASPQAAPELLSLLRREIQDRWKAGHSKVSAEISAAQEQAARGKREIQM